MPIAPDLTDATIEDLLDLTGRTAVITGGAAGLGRAIARRYAQAGATVYIGDLDEEAATATAEALDGDVRPMAMDATDGADHDAIADRAIDETGRLDIWVNNAGIYPFVDFEDMTEDDWRKVVSLNLDGTFLGARTAADRMVELGEGGLILNMSSTAGYGAEGAGISHYVATKHGVRGLTKSLALELGEHGIRSLALAPTLIETEGTQAGADDIESSQDDGAGAIAERAPLGRAGVPDDVARVALFAASGLSSFMTGDTLLIDAGVRTY